MKTISASEIKKRGISVVDDIFKEQESVPIIHRSKIKYVVLEKETFDNLIKESTATYQTQMTKEEIEKAWIEEAEKRWEAIKSGKSQTISYEEVIRSLKK